MATIKMCTDIPQSKKLAKFLPLESADMWFANVVIITKNSVNEPDDIKSVFPCWSLAALLSIIPPYYQLQTQDNNEIGILCSYKGNTIIVAANNPVDACYEMILKLHERKLL